MDSMRLRYTKGDEVSAIFQRSDSDTAIITCASFYSPETTQHLYAHLCYYIRCFRIRFHVHCAMININIKRIAHTIAWFPAIYIRLRLSVKYLHCEAVNFLPFARRAHELFAFLWSIFLLRFGLEGSMYIIKINAPAVLKNPICAPRFRGSPQSAAGVAAH